MKKIQFLFVSLFSIVCLNLFATNISNSYGFYEDNIIDFSEDGIAENIVNGKLVQYTMLDLKVGDVFIDVDGNVKKVANIVNNGSEIIIDTVEPLIEEVFQEVYVPEQEVDCSNMETFYQGQRDVLCSDGSFVTLNQVEQNAGRGSITDGMIDAIMPNRNKDIAITFKYDTNRFKKEGEKKTISGLFTTTLYVGNKIYENKISPSFAYSKLVMKSKKLFWKIRVYYPTFTTGHGTIKAKGDYATAFALSIKGCAQLAQEVPLCGTPAGSSAYANVFVRPAVTFGGDVTYQHYSRTTFEKEYGVEFVSIVPKGRINKSKDMSITGNYIKGGISLYGEIMIGVKAGLKVGGFTVLEGRFEGGISSEMAVGVDWSNIKMSSGNTYSSSYPDFNLIQDYMAGHQETPSLKYYIGANLKLRATLIVLDFINWSPLDKSFQLFSAGDRGYYLANQPLDY